MRKILLISICILTVFSSNAQYFGKKSIGISQSAIFFSTPSLNNKNNANDKTSWVSEIDKNIFITRFWSLNFGAGLGNYKNPDNRFETYQSSNFYRFKFALMLHLPSSDKCDNCNKKPNLLSPFLLVGYNFDVLNKNFKAVGDNRVCANMKVGGGLTFRVSKETGVFYSFTLNQRVNSDYRTYYQHCIGLLVNLDREGVAAN